MSFILQENNNVFKTKFTTSGAFVIILLGLSLLALSERVLYDVARLFVSGPLDYFENVNIIIMHAVIIMIFLIIALLVNVFISDKKQKYAIALVPYYVVSIFLCCQLILQVSVYFYHNHTTFQFYVVMLALIVICTYSIYFIQKNRLINE